MRNQANLNVRTHEAMASSDWVKWGFLAAAASIIAVLVVQALATSIWPEIALFGPLDNYFRSAIFTLVPTVVATALFAWLAGHTARPVRAFIVISVVVLLISFIPDYAVPVPYKTILASTVAAFLHVVAAVATVSLLVIGINDESKAKPPQITIRVIKNIGNREEIEGLMADLLYVNSPPAGPTRLTDWLKENASILGVRYASELARRKS